MSIKFDRPHPAPINIGSRNQMLEFIEMNVGKVKSDNQIPKESNSVVLLFQNHTAHASLTIYSKPNFSGVYYFK